MSRVYTKEQKQKRQQQQNSHRQNNREGRAKVLYDNYKRIDRKKCRAFDLTRDFIILMLYEKCVYCGEENFKKIGLDRKDNNVGHTIKNSLPCCLDCNYARSDKFTHEEMLLIGKVITKIKKQRIKK